MFYDEMKLQLHEIVSMLTITIINVRYTHIACIPSANPNAEINDRHVVLKDGLSNAFSSPRNAQWIVRSKHDVSQNIRNTIIFDVKLFVCVCARSGDAGDLEQTGILFARDHA